MELQDQFGDPARSARLSSLMVPEAFQEYGENEKRVEEYGTGGG